MKIMDTYLITYINNIIYTYYKCLDFIKIIKIFMKLTMSQC